MEDELELSVLANSDESKLCAYLMNLKRKGGLYVLIPKSKSSGVNVSVLFICNNICKYFYNYVFTEKFSY